MCSRRNVRRLGHRSGFEELFKLVNFATMKSARTEASHPIAPLKAFCFCFNLWRMSQLNMGQTERHVP
jgi:hypothetical protein